MLYTEFHYGNKGLPNERADLAVIRPESDVEKAVQYIAKQPSKLFIGARFYLAFLNETSYGPLDPEHHSYTIRRPAYCRVGASDGTAGYPEHEA